MAESWKDFVAGWVGGGTGIAFGHPLDTIRVKFHSFPFNFNDWMIAIQKIALYWIFQVGKGKFMDSCGGIIIEKKLKFFGIH